MRVEAGRISPSGRKIGVEPVAGAMPTMIAETMLPEAYNKGSSVTGLAKLFE
jgi:hypothetical protein